MATPKRIFLRGAYNLYNLGDDLVLIAWLDFWGQTLRLTNDELLPYIAARSRSLPALRCENQARLNYVEAPDIADCMNDTLAKLRLPIRFPSTIRLLRGIKNRSLICLCWLLLLALLATTGAVVYRLSGKGIFARRFWDFLKGLDMVHYTAGGYVADWWSTMLLYEFLVVSFIKIVNPGVKVIGTGLGIGPLKNRFHRAIFRLFSGHFDYLSVREAESLQLLEALHLGADRKILGDDALLLYPSLERLKHNRANTAGMLLALNLKDFPGYEYSLIADALGNYLKVLVTRGGGIGYFCFGRDPGPDDRALIRVFAQEYRRGFTIHDPYEEGWSSFIACLAQSGMGLGFAYHFGIVLTMLDIPIVGVYCGEYYRQKMDGGMKLLNKDAVVLSMEELSHRNVAEVMSIAQGRRREETRARMASMYRDMVSEYAKLYG